ncbi:MAG: ATP-binding cassette domain-containing protein [Spirochaetaceae bacterium]|nr:ATP-binding cassette domain-containing protein [Spirochaetaceae bacterium]
MNETVIEVDHLYKSYADTKAVQDLSFRVTARRCHAFLGPNGAGKTTAMKVLYGKAKPNDHPETRINVFGYDPRLHELKIKTLSGVVPQEDNLDLELNVQQNLQIFSKFYNLSGAQAQRQIDCLLEFMELTEKRKSQVRELSGGMKRRLIIARSLLNNPSLLIMDEPTTGLDPQVRQLIWDKLRELMKGGVTILLSTHYMEEAYQIADVLTIMDRGRKIMEGAPGELLENEVEGHVLEVTDLEHSDRFELAMDGAPFRKEQSSQRAIYYAADAGALERAAGRIPRESYIMRKSNLEDLFLRATGRHLNEDQ